MAWSEERRRQHGEMMRRYFADPAFAARHAENMRRARRDPGFRERHRQKMLAVQAEKRQARLAQKIYKPRRKKTAAQTDKQESFKKPRPVKTRRPCMSCRNPFWSDGPHHRLCVSCRSGTGLPDYAVPL